MHDLLSLGSGKTHVISADRPTIDPPVKKGDVHNLRAHRQVFTSIQSRTLDLSLWPEALGDYPDPWHGSRESRTRQSQIHAEVLLHWQRTGYEGSISSDAEKHYQEGLTDNRHVSGQRPVFDVVDIQLNHALVVQFATPTDLPRTGHSR